MIMENMREKATKWIEDIISTKSKLRLLQELNVDDNSVKLCGVDDSIHVFRGIERIAFYLGKTLTYNPNWDRESGRMSMYYAGHEIFQIWDKKEA